MASDAVFADTSFFFALAAKKDAAHPAAVSALARLLRQQRRVITTDYILDETLTLTKARTNATVSVALLDRIERSPAVVFEPLTFERLEAAKAYFRKHADHAYSFTDCTSFVVMRELRLREALTTDRHFTEAGFRPCCPFPKPIPPSPRHSDPTCMTHVLQPSLGHKWYPRLTPLAELERHDGELRIGDLEIRFWRP